MSTPREVVLAALRHEVPDCIPAYVRKIHDWQRHATVLGVSALPELMDLLGNTIVSFAPAYLAVEPPIAAEQLTPGMPPIWGVAGDVEPYSYSDALPRPLADATTAADVDAYAWPSAAASAWDFALMRRALAGDQVHARLGPSWNPVFSQLCLLFGMEQAMVNLRWNRVVVEAALAHLDDFYTTFYGHMLDMCGDKLELFGLGDDFAANRGLLIRPEEWRRLLLPLYAKWLGMAKVRGLFTLMHCCGRIVDVLPDLIDNGLDAWQTVQTHLPDQDPTRLKAQFGSHLTFVGAVDTTNILGVGSPEQVRSHVEDQICLLGRNGGYICGPDHTILEEVPTENVVALYLAVAEFHREGYTLDQSMTGLRSGQAADGDLLESRAGARGGGQ
jgi:uroporphyrinogen decarboxylase